MNPVNMNMNMGSPTSLFDQFYHNLMTMTMFQSASNSSASNPNSSIIAMIYIFAFSQFIKYIPVLFAHVKTFVENFIREKSKQTIFQTITTEKSASIQIQIQVDDVANYVCQALLHHVTLHKNTKHIQYVNKIYVLNETSVIDIGQDMFMKLLSAVVDPTIVVQSQEPADKSKGLVQHVELFSYTKTAIELRHFLDKITTQYTIDTQNNLGNKRFYFNMQPVSATPVLQNSSQKNPANASGKDYSKLLPFFTFNMKRFQTNRKFSNLFGDNIKAIRKRVQFFLNNEEWYNQKGIPYTLGLLLTGPPGTGKTSCIKCLANETDRHIININMNSDITKKQIESLFFDEEIKVVTQLRPEIFRIPLDKRIYVFEDIDCQGDVVLERGGHSTSVTTETEKMDMSFLLNILDGILETPGRIVIMTTNFVDKLDKALIRPGRIDIIAELGRCENDTVIEMVEYFTNSTLSDEHRNILLGLPSNLFTPAELSKILFENMNEPIRAVVECIQKKSNLNCKNPSIPVGCTGAKCEMSGPLLTRCDGTSRKKITQTYDSVPLDGSASDIVALPQEYLNSVYGKYDIGCTGSTQTNPIYANYDPSLNEGLKRRGFFNEWK
jgi:hypothetical protein